MRPLFLQDSNYNNKAFVLAASKRAMALTAQARTEYTFKLQKWRILTRMAVVSICVHVDKVSRKATAQARASPGFCSITVGDLPVDRMLLYRPVIPIVLRRQSFVYQAGLWNDVI